MRKIATIIAFLALGQGVNANAPSVELVRKFAFSEATISGFEVRAQTEVSWPSAISSSRYPSVYSVDCYGASPEVEFSVDETGNLKSLWFRFLKKPDPEGDQEEITLLGDQLKLFIDGVEYQYRNIPRPNEKFKNLDYPDPPSDADNIIVVPWIGHTAVRKSEKDPWMNISRIFGQISNAKKISWSFVSRDWSVVDQSEESNALPARWRTTKYPVDVVGLKQSLEWCTKEMDSGKGRILPPKILEQATQ